MRNKMRIKCAAIRFRGKIYEGRSHYGIGLKMIADCVCEKPYPSGDAQGFVTECGRYVRRAPALMIAIDAGQVEEGKTISDRELFSEDLRQPGKERLAPKQTQAVIHGLDELGVCLCQEYPGQRPGKDKSPLQLWEVRHMLEELRDSETPYTEGLECIRNAEAALENLTKALKEIEELGFTQQGLGYACAKIAKKALDENQEGSVT